MGSAKRLRKLYEKPKKLWDAQRISEERKLLADYGLKNMHELWRIKTILRNIRREARSLLAHRGTGAQTRKKQMLDKVQRMMVNKTDVSLDDVLSLSTRDILERRLETIVVRKGMAKTMAQLPPTRLNRMSRILGSIATEKTCYRHSYSRRATNPQPDGFGMNKTKNQDVPSFIR